MSQAPPRRIKWRLGAVLAGLAGLVVSVAAAIPNADAAVTKAGSTGYVDAMTAVAQMQPGWNVGNTLDAIPEETSWGMPVITKQLFDTIRAQGFHSVRIPVTWSNHQASTAPYTVDPAFLARVKQVVDWAIADNLYVLLNVHHDSWQWISSMTTDHDNVLARFNATWTQITATLKDEPGKLLLESVNEPFFNNATDAQKTQLLNELNTSFYNIVRNSGGNNGTRLLVLPTLGTGGDQSQMDDLLSEMASLNDHNLIATVHYYSFWPFGVNIAGFTKFDGVTVQDLLGWFARVHDNFIAKGIPVIVGEYSIFTMDKTPLAVEQGEMLKYFEMFGDQARINHVTTMLWDNGCFLDRNTGLWRQPEIIAQIKSAWTTNSGSASSDMIFVPKSGPITSQTMTLNLNGNKLVKISQGGYELAKGVDYTISGDQLTLTAGTLTRLVGDRSYGVNTSLQLTFGHGLPWKIDVRTQDTPVLSDATGTTSGLAIPTDFRGDVLATMEAKYDDGSNAGTATWTSYQEYTYNFYADYTTKVINMTDHFLNAITDGARVTLTFHFWSGATVTYYVTKSGGSVTGSTS